MQNIIKFEDLENADLIVDAVYEGGTDVNVKGDPISKLLGCGNLGGFRYLGSTDPFELKYVVLYSSLLDPDWPDSLDNQTGIFTYFGDNKDPGNQLHRTRKKGNYILKECFNMLHNSKLDKIPPFFIFTKGTKGRDVVFRGVAVPGAKNLTSFDDLVAIWKIKGQERFQNYRAIFTILDIDKVTRNWIKDLQNGNIITHNTPKAFKEWVEKGIYRPLIAERTVEYRKKEEQLPTGYDEKFIEEIINYFKDGYAFEHCAVEIFKLMDSNVIECNLTRPWVDGGRDAVGKYRIGNANNYILVDFALEAKKYNLNNAVGVKEISRLISRLRNRQFGVIVTTSYVNMQAYKEIKEDGHPIIIICAKDIVDILKNKGITTIEDLQNWLNKNFKKEVVQ
ncbi:restriction endonuclease [Thermovenabulum gondwanense]|uniref:Restriction endonuclease type IV Mrr domain-containing protein n=1 Tax=Thermovenabulum gondwanense TaxID=520767 RepID=A0A162MYC7_9FIRM|nr:restriction endonuclease [Thermovenabulum gondwanense]KYO68553.1 hypothetical protein ATZ99_00620 [Thermovenabulum gondwanense]